MEFNYSDYNTLEEIPQQVVDEINAAYSTVDFSSYGTIDEGTKSRRSVYVEYIPFTEDSVVGGAISHDESGEMQIIKKNCSKDEYCYSRGFVVRVNETKDGTSIRMVVPTRC
jgi:hypothetical protein